jgi:hypothetical protein
VPSTTEECDGCANHDIARRWLRGTRGARRPCRSVPQCGQPGRGVSSVRWRRSSRPGRRCHSAHPRQRPWLRGTRGERAAGGLTRCPCGLGPGERPVGGQQDQQRGVSGSVVVRVNRPPRCWPATHMATAAGTARHSATRAAVPNTAVAAPGCAPIRRTLQVTGPAPGRGSRRGCREHPGEALTKHEGLVLQHRVEQPQGGRRQLERAPPVRRFPSCPARRGGDRVARARDTPAIHPQLAANSQSQSGLLGSPNAPGVLRCAIKIGTWL